MVAVSPVRGLGQKLVCTIQKITNGKLALAFVAIKLASPFMDNQQMLQQQMLSQCSTYTISHSAAQT
jgi:hypothetical protein